jgi:hypothetical protein
MVTIFAQRDERSVIFASQHPGAVITMVNLGSSVVAARALIMGLF